MDDGLGNFSDVRLIGQSVGFAKYGSQELRGADGNPELAVSGRGHPCEITTNAAETRRFAPDGNPRQRFSSRLRLIIC